MKSITIIDTLEDIIAHKIQSCIVLYSGGVDGSYFLDWAANRDIEVLALSIRRINDEIADEACPTPKVLFGDLMTYRAGDAVFGMTRCVAVRDAQAAEMNEIVGAIPLVHGRVLRA